MNFQNSISRLCIGLAVISTCVSCNNDTTKIRLVFPTKVNYESFIIANDKNLFYDTDSNISVKTVNSGTNAAEAFATGNADIIASGVGPAIILLAGDHDAVIVTRYATGERMHHLVADTSIRFTEDLAGKRIGVQYGSSTHAALLAWLKNNNIPVSSIELVPMQPANMPEAMKNKQLDAIAGSQPWAINVEKMCGDVVFELTDLYDPSNCNSLVLTTKREFYNNNKKKIEALLEDLELANEVINNNPEESAGIVSKYTGLTPDEQKRCTGEMKWSIGFDQNDVNSLEKTAKILYELNLINEIPDIPRRFAGTIKP